MTALLGTLSVLLLCRISRRLFRSTFLGCLAGALLAVDGLHFVMSRTALGDKAGGTPGVELVARHAEGTGAADTSLLTLAEGEAGRLQTTLSATAQAAAEKAVKRYPESSVVAVKQSTGEVLAVANNRADGWNAAFLGQVAPGSTMKTLSAAMLIDTGLTSMDGPAPCPPTAVSESQTFGNLPGLEPNPNATLSESFARSCNTAFVKFADEVRADSLTREAEDRFGIGRTWQVGVPSFDGSVPASGGPDTAANLLGQGQVQMNPLNMASVTATATTGAFRQPVIVPRALDDRELATARGLDASTVQQLRAMMNRTARQHRPKTGTAEVDGAKANSWFTFYRDEVDNQKKPNGWFTAYRDDLAAAGVVQAAGHGGETAWPIVAALLKLGD
ncbi:Penicillin-binding protein OS=Streptomyces glaucescens OX=1907 GN=SGLAU_14375 PE=3 SV=1 [Streptomyces glaucescens]